MNRALTPPPAYFTCPGETIAIPRAVHLARLAAFYPACQHCEHRCETGLLPPSIVARWEDPGATQVAQIRVVGDGLRGRYLNDLGRADARRIASNFTDWLDQLQSEPRKEPLTVVVGYDERPTSPDLAIGVVEGLRRGGCLVIDLGQTLKPAWQAAVGTLSAAAGLFVTGAGYDPAWTGIDGLGPAGVPIDAVDLWQRWWLPGNVVPPSRMPGGHSPRPMWDEYAAGLPRVFHALRPWRLVCGTTSPLVERFLPQLFTGLPCELQVVRLTQPRSADELAVQSAQLREVILKTGADLGIGLGEDLQSLFVLDEFGTVTPVEVWGPWLLERLLAEDRGATAVVTAAAIECAPRLAALAKTVESGTAEFVTALHQPSCLGGLDGRLRFWSSAPSPACDALKTLAALLRAASWSAAPVSEQWGGGLRRNA